MEEDELTPKEEQIINRKPLNHLVDASLAIEKLRVESQVRQTHLKLRNNPDPETDELHARIQALEDYVDGRVAKLIVSHPAYPWFSRVKGIGNENIGKVVAQVDIERASTISALWRYCGYAVINGKAERRTKDGGKLHYNAGLRTMCWRLGSSLMRARGKFYEYYLAQKEVYREHYKKQGWKIVPVAQLPKVDGKKIDGGGYLAEGHLHNMALRKMIKLFLGHLWLKWREAEGLPVTKPYAIDKLEHDSFIDPEEMTDR